MALLVSSCAVTGFKQSAAVTLELRFNAWDAVCITKPNTRVQGFIPVLNATEALQEIERLNVPRDFAVVVVNSNYDAQQVLGIAAEWYKQLAALGFERVVVMRGNDSFPIAGLPITFDSAISSVHETPGRTQPYAAAPTALGTDVANPPVPAIR